MELTILLPRESSKEGIIHLKNFIDKACIEGVQNTEIDRAPHKEGQMGMGNILLSLTTIIDAELMPLADLLKCLQKYADNYRTVITIPTSNGEIIIRHGGGTGKEQLDELVVDILNTNNA